MSQSAGDAPNPGDRPFNNQTTEQATEFDDSVFAELEAPFGSPPGDASIPISTKAHTTVAARVPLRMVETAFLASTASLIWLVNFYFPLGPVLRMFFPLPIALLYLRWGGRASWMGCLVSGLLLSVLMGPPRSLLYVMPFGLMGVVLGWLWRRSAGWGISILLGTLLGSIGFFFRLWLMSIMLGDDLWVYLTTQVTNLIEWFTLRFGLLFKPELLMVQLVGMVLVFFSNLVYLFAVHLVAWLMLERLGNPISTPPKWVQIMMDYEV